MVQWIYFIKCSFFFSVQSKNKLYTSPHTLSALGYTNFKAIQHTWEHSTRNTLFSGPRCGKALSNLCRAVLLLQHCHSDAHKTHNHLKKKQAQIAQLQMKSASKRTGTFGEKWKGQNESKDFSLKRPVLQKAISLVLETEEKRSRLWACIYPNCLLNPEPCFNST